MSMFNEPNPFSVKALKQKLEDNELDLSMVEMVQIPVKEIAQIKRATRLDLSVNRLKMLPHDFANSLSHLVKLDLSQNQLTALPENFGNLQSLQTLDLYKNFLTTLPVSFCRLKQLKWLDVKDNPLDDDVRKVTGDCLDAKQCALAANRIVPYMKRVQADQERQRQKILDKKREEEAIARAAEEAVESEQRHAKKKDKERRKEEKLRAHNAHNGHHRSRFAERYEDDKKSQKRQKAVDRKSKSSSGIAYLLWSLLYITLFVIKYALIVTFVLGVCTALIVYFNCSSRPEWIPNSRPFCHEVHLWTSQGIQHYPSWKTTNAALLGFKQISVEHSQVVYQRAKHGASHLAHTVSSVEYGKLAESAYFSISQSATATAKWAEKDLAPRLRVLANTSHTYALWAWAETKRVSVQTYTTVVNANYTQVWENAKFYWRNLK